MQIQICDAQWKPTSELIDATARGANPIRPNETPRFTFGVRRDHPAADSLQLATNILIFGKMPARIIKRDEPGHEVHVEALGCEDMLNNLMTPRRWVRYNDMDLSAVVSDLMSRFRMVRWTTLADWQGAYDVANVEIVNLDTIGDSVILATEPYCDADRYLASGHIVLRCQLPATALATGRVVRWTEHVGSENRIKVQTRAADDAVTLDATPWGPEIELIHAEEIEDNETIGADVENGGRWVDIRLNLYTEDRETVDNEHETTIVGTTPVLAGMELIYREAGPIAIGNVPATGVKVTDTEYNRMSHLKVLQELCNAYGYSYRLRLENGTLVLDLAKTFGADRSGEVVLAHNDNCLVDVLTTGDDELANVLHCWGAGSGAEQLYIELTDQDSIALYGERHADFEDTDITDTTALAEKGQAELDRRKEPRHDYQVRTSLELLGVAWIQDTVSVVDPQGGTVRTADIKELNITDDPQDGEVVRIGLGAKIVTLVDEIATHLPKESGKKAQPPLAAPMLRVKGKYEAIGLTWNMVAGASGYDLECSEDGGATWKLLVSGLAALRYDHELPLGAERKYRAFAKRGGARSAASNTVAGRALDTVAPSLSEGIYVLPAIRGLTVVLRPQNNESDPNYATDWSRVPDWAGAEVHVGNTEDFAPSTATLKDSGKNTSFTVPWPSGTVGYVKVRVYDTSGNYSGYVSHYPAGVAAGKTISEDYAEIRNNLPYTGLDSLDATHPIEFDFYLPEETTRIVAIFLSAKGLRYRAYSETAAEGADIAKTSGIAEFDGVPCTDLAGSHTHPKGTFKTVYEPDHEHKVSEGSVVTSHGDGPFSTSSDGKHNHNYSGYTSPQGEYYSGDTSEDGDHSHTIGDHGHVVPIDIMGSAGGHEHALTGELAKSGTHKHAIENMAHTHEVIIPGHVHPLVYGIHEETTPAGVKLYYDDGTGYCTEAQAITLAAAPDESTPYDLVMALPSGLKYAGHTSELDLTAKFSGAGWKRIKFTSARRGRINWSLIAKVDLTA